MDFDDALKLAEMLGDEEDLNHKLVSWMLNYALEKFPENERQPT